MKTSVCQKQELVKGFTLPLPSLQEAELERTPQAIVSAMIAKNPALQNMRRLTMGRPWVEPHHFSDHVSKYGFGFLNRDAIGLIERATQSVQGRLLSVFTGLGYAEAQLASAGLEVVGFDQAIHPMRWLQDVREGPAGLKYSRFADSALFMSFPDRTKSGESFATQVIEKFTEAGGEIVLVISERREHKHAFGSDEALYKKLKEAECLETVALPKWPVLVTLTVARQSNSTFEPILKAYKFPSVGR